jgi:hypothetical protein
MSDHFISEIEKTAWNALKSFSGGGEEAVYQQGETEFPIHVVLVTPVPDGFAFEDFRIYKTSHVFEVETSELNGITPKEGDAILRCEKKYMVKKTRNGPCYEHVGSYNVSVQIHTSIFS